MTEYSISPSANTPRGATDYMDYRTKQLGKFGFALKERKVIDIGVRYIYIEVKTGKEFQSIYILRGERGQGKYWKALEETDLPVITMPECAITDKLREHNIEHTVKKHSIAYSVIQRYYKDKRANRSGVPFIYHIDEGGTILEALEQPNHVKDAYYLHPLLQDDAEFLRNYNGTSLFRKGNFDINPLSLTLAMEYRHIANSYLSTGSPEDFYGFTCPEVKQMLIADKVQNFKDFMTYHYGTHKRTGELFEYFLNWEDLLEINYNDYIPIIK